MVEFNQKLLDHFLNPRNVGEMNNPDGYGRAYNPINQYLTDIYLQVKDGRIHDIKFKTFGCVVTIAAASALTTAVKGKTILEIIDRKDMLQFLFELIQHELGMVPEENWHCPPTAAQALLMACLDYYKKIKDDERVKKIEQELLEIQCYFEQKTQEK